MKYDDTEIQLFTIKPISHECKCYNFTKKIGYYYIHNYNKYSPYHLVVVCIKRIMFPTLLLCHRTVT